MPQTHTDAHRRIFPERIALRWAMMVVVLLVSACSTNRLPIINLYDVGPVSGVEKKLRRNAAKWQGVPYRYGGTNRRGIDCSALVEKIYAATFNVRLPRTVRGQMSVGHPVGQRPLEAGDMVFFDTGVFGLHAGIYLGRGEFVHVSSRKGVTISNIGSRYWRRRYRTARRLATTD